jgi:uncharacterized protein (TIGR02246 family)
MDALTELVAKQACTDLVTRYALAVNAWDLDAFVDLFTADAVWQRPSAPPLHGQAEIRAFMVGQPTNRVLRHVLGGTHVELVDDSTARVWSQTTTYEQLGSIVVPANLVGPLQLVEYRDEQVRADGTWRIARRDTAVVFLRTPVGV